VIRVLLWGGAMRCQIGFSLARDTPGYNRSVQRLALLTAAMLLAACSRDIQNTEAVRQGVLDYLKAGAPQTGLDVDKMQVDVTSVSFQATEARAAVSIKPKTSDTGGPMMINYTLDRKGSKWVVRGRTENGVNPHGNQALPPDHPPVSPKQ
jgi:hypothetical protein